MKISSFTNIVTESEGKKVQVSVAQVAEIMKLVNKLTDGELYRIIRSIK
jgi:hypothetical protein